MRSSLNLLIISIVVFLQSCSKPQEQFLSVQICVLDQDGLMQLKKIMSETARSEGLYFIDNSAQQGRNLREADAEPTVKSDARLAFDVHIEGEAGMGATAGNLGLPPYQVAVGFTEGSDAAKAHRLADRLIKSLPRRWRVMTIARGRGAVPSATCVGAGRPNAPLARK